MDNATKLTLPAIMQVKELWLGDIVRVDFSGGEYSDATVYEMYPNGDAKVWRPYVTTADFSMGGSTMGASRSTPYIGIEDFTLYSSSKVTLLRRGDRKR